MSNLARQLRLERQQNQQREVTVKNDKPTKKGLLSPGEKMLGITFGALVFFGSLHIISNQASIYGLNTGIQDSKTTIQEQNKINSDLNIQVSELSQYERIRAKANELGLQLNDQNVKVVQD